MSERLQYLVIHCTATAEGRIVFPNEIERWHKSAPPFGRGWDRVGYSKLFLLDGKVHSFVNEDDDDLVDPWELTYGAVGINRISRHICYVGGLATDGKTAKDTRTVAQEFAMAKYVIEMVAKYPWLVIAGHYHFANKACPSFDVKQWCEYLKLPEQNFMQRRLGK